MPGLGRPPHTPALRLTCISGCPAKHVAPTLPRHEHQQRGGTEHPFAGPLLQSLDNQIVAYSTKDRFRQNRKKTFKGHNTAGYACQVGRPPLLPSATQALPSFTPPVL